MLMLQIMAANAMHKATKVLKGRRGATMVEYGVMVALIVAVVIGIVTTLGKTVNTMFGNVNTAIAPAP